jgi:hypothetical protein
MDTKDTLLGIERDLLERGADAYRRHLGDHALVVAPNEVLDKEAIVAAVEAVPVWDEYEIATVGMIQPADDEAILSYRFAGIRDGELYEAYTSSAYALEGGAWKLVLRQQAPVPNAVRELHPGQAEAAHAASARAA